MQLQVTNPTTKKTTTRYRCDVCQMMDSTIDTDCVAVCWACNRHLCAVHNYSIPIYDRRGLDLLNRITLCASCNLNSVGHITAIDTVEREYKEYQELLSAARWRALQKIKDSIAARRKTRKS